MSKAFYAGFSILLLAVGLSLALPQSRVWGLHFLAYYPPQARIIFIALAAAVLVWGFFPARRRFKRPAAGMRLSFSPLQWDVVTAVSCGLLFLVFFSKTALYGDGQLWLNEIGAGAVDYLRNRAPFTLFLLHTLYRWLNPLTGIEAQRLFALTSAVAGAVAVLGWLKLARFLKINHATSLLFGFAWGGVALFFGYVETYTLMTAILTWMLVETVISLRKGDPSLLVPILGVLAVGFNLSAIVFLPTVAVYCWRMFSGEPLRPRNVLISSFAVFVAAMLAYFIFGWYNGTNVLLPLVRTQNAFGDYVFSAAHMADLINGLLLGAGAFLVLVVAYIIAESEAGFRWNDERLILLLTLIFPLAACIMHNPQLGMARDWDICAVLLLAAPVISLVIWDSLQPFVQSPTRVYALVGAWTLVVTLPWVGVLASEGRSVERFKDLLRLDGAKSESGWDYLSSYYLHRNRIEEWGQCNIEALRYSDNPRYHNNAALYFAMKRDWPNANYQAGRAHTAVIADSVVTAWEKSVTDPDALISLGNSFLERSRVQDAQFAYDVAARLQPDSPRPEIARAELFIRLRRLAGAETVIERVAAKGPEAMAEAQRYFAAKCSRDGVDDQTVGWLGRSLIARRNGDFEEAQKCAGKAMTLSRDIEIEQLSSEMNALATQKTSAK